MCVAVLLEPFFSADFEQEVKAPKLDLERLRRLEAERGVRNEHGPIGPLMQRFASEPEDAAARLQFAQNLCKVLDHKPVEVALLLNK